MPVYVRSEQWPDFVFMADAEIDEVGAIIGGWMRTRTVHVISDPGGTGAAVFNLGATASVTVTTVPPPERVTLFPLPAGGRPGGADHS